MFNEVEVVDWSEPSPRFAINIIRESKEKETTYWNYAMQIGPTHPLALYYDLNLVCEEARTILNNVTANSTYKDVTFTKLQRIQNPFLMAQYLLNKEQYKGKSCDLHVRTLIHGTKEKNIDSIVNNNFDMGLIKRAKHGHGINFTNDIVFASKFTDRNPRKLTAIIAYVLQAKTCNGNTDMTYPTRGADTSLSFSPCRYQIIVKYDEDTFYPAYLLTYQIPRSRFM